jgi:uncharacterized protein YbjT (DUF2867 family)
MPPEATSPAEPLTALLVGGTGLVGRALLNELLASKDYGTVRVLARKRVEPASSVKDPSKLDARVVDFDEPKSWADAAEAHHVFCTLGTTIKKAGSEKAFRHVDLELPLSIARRAREAGARALFVVTALGADPDSRVFYYRVKGELERELRELGYPTLGVFRPSLLTGHRPEARSAERLGIAAASAVAPLMRGSLRRYRPIAARDVARAMVTVAVACAESRDPMGISVYESDAIAELATRGPSLSQ